MITESAAGGIPGTVSLACAEPEGRREAAVPVVKPWRSKKAQGQEQAGVKAERVSGLRSLRGGPDKTPLDMSTGVVRPKTGGNLIILKFDK